MKKLAILSAPPRAILCLLSAFFALCCMSLLSAQVTAPVGSVTRQVIYAPLAGMEGFEHWDLYIVSHAPIEQPASITVFSKEGKPFPAVSVPVPGNGTLHMDIANSLPEVANHQTTGGVAIEYYGPPMGLAAQITLRQFSRFRQHGRHPRR